MLFGVYLLIRKRAVLRYIYRLLAVYVSLLANIGVLYQILSLISSRFEKNVRDTALIAGFSILDTRYWILDSRFSILDTRFFYYEHRATFVFLHHIYFYPACVQRRQHSQGRRGQYDTERPANP